MFSLFKKSPTVVVPESLVKPQMLLTAIQKNSPEGIKSAIQNGADLNQSVDENGRTPLMLHVIREDPSLKIVKALVENGADVNAKTKMGNTPLILATRNEDSYMMIDIIKFLVENGADVNAKNNDGKKALNYSGRVDVVNFLKPLTTSEVREWSGGRRRKTYRKKSKKSKKTRKH